MVLALRKAQLEPGAVAALVREGGDDLGVRFDGRFELGIRFEGFEAGVRQQTAKLLELGHAPGLGRPDAGRRSRTGSSGPARPRP